MNLLRVRQMAFTCTALLLFSAASAQEMVHHERTVVTHTEVHPAHATVQHNMRKVCHNYWSQHRRMHSCKMVRWNS